MSTASGNSQQSCDYEQPISERILQGELAAEAELVSIHSDPMLRVIHNRVRNTDIAHDLLHDSLLAALVILRKRPLTDPQKLGNYLLRIARFQTANYLRCKSDRMISQANPDVDSLSGDLEPCKAYAQWHGHQQVKRLIDSLPVTRDRRVATRFYLQEESKARICNELDISTARFDGILYRIKKRLQKLAFGGEFALAD